jgi:hypothetical protein
MRFARFSLGLAVIVFSALHAAFAWHSRDIRPDLAILSAPPARLEAKALAFGDDAFLYRVWVLGLQNAGDTGGRATPMRDYNYAHVAGWLETLDALDPRAQHHLFLATGYFSLSPHAPDVRRIVDFVVKASTARPAQNWYWLAQAMTLAERRLDDTPYALAISQQLAALDFPEMPAWLIAYPAILFERLGRYEEAKAAIANVEARRAGSIPDTDKLWMDDLSRRLRVHAP